MRGVSDISTTSVLRAPPYVGADSGPPLQVPPVVPTLSITPTVQVALAPKSEPASSWNDWMLFVALTIALIGPDTSNDLVKLVGLSASSHSNLKQALISVPTLLGL